ncbi:MAG: hypothetical protein ACT4OI_07040, partial [Methanobacteriota archaeon]
DELAKDPAKAVPILPAFVFVVAMHDDPQLHPPLGMLTLLAARELLHLTRPPGGLGLLRFLVMYNFSLTKRALTADQAEANARAVPSASIDELRGAYRKAVAGNLGGQAAALLGRIALDHGIERAAHAAIRASMDDLGRLGHNLALAVGYSEAASALGKPRALVPLANLAHVQATALASVRAVAIPSMEPPADVSPDVGALEALVEAWEFDRVEGVLRALAFDEQADVAYTPLLVAASADPGFLGHTLSLVHDARLATRYLSATENAWLLWKLYRTLTKHFGYPEFLELGGHGPIDEAAVWPAIESSLKHKSPPAEETVRRALESGVPVDRILAFVVDFYGNWTVGEKEHTILYLDAALQTARFLGRDRALLPLAIALSKLPF